MIKPLLLVIAEACRIGFQEKGSLVITSFFRPTLVDLIAESDFHPMF